MNNDPVDFMTLIIILLATVTGRETSALLGPYAAIIIFAFLGSSISLTNNEIQMGAFRSIIYILARVLIACVLTVSLAKILHNSWPDASIHYTLIPLSFLIGWIDNYRKLMKSIIDIILLLANKKIINEAFSILKNNFTKKEKK